MGGEGLWAAKAVFFFILIPLFPIQGIENDTTLLSMELYMLVNFIACGILGCFNPS